ncbi:hypothetical protein ANCDUO_03222 [Ancylostoma duodenale]|uniref:Tc1-like transposase DDE domain-containing protein n=1 Tax=Ancylostoma duodenale TaxID=51022 RepID=A0A0C2GY74_9BILA|nr:hypothetical protein ANCDUO_03222 [Ancylostoma duodenale]
MSAYSSYAASAPNKLQYFVGSRGGVAAVRSYAIENICAEFGVTVIRLPPYHCFFNPIEMCWSQMKGHLTKLGKPTDALQTDAGLDGLRDHVAVQEAVRPRRVEEEVAKSPWISTTTWVTVVKFGPQTNPRPLMRTCLR